MKVCPTCGSRFTSDDWRCPDCGCQPRRLNGFLSFSQELASENKGFDARVFERLYEIEEGSFWFKSRNRILIEIIRQYFPDARNLLEIGCGTGYVLSGIMRAFPDMTLYGSEIYYNGLDYARKRLPGVELFQMDARTIPFDSHFDVIGAFDVLEHIDEDETVLANMVRAVKPHGGIVLTVPQHPFLWSYVDDYSYHKRRYTRKDLVSKVKKAGCEIVRVTSFVSLLFPLMVLSRLAKSKMKGTFDPFKEHTINRYLSVVLEKIMTVERMMIKAGVSLPMGGSLLVVARRI